jgi:hypothetical protein
MARKRQSAAVETERQHCHQRQAGNAKQRPTAATRKARESLQALDAIVTELHEELDAPPVAESATSVALPPGASPFTRADAPARSSHVS